VEMGYDYIDDGFGFFSNLKTPLGRSITRSPRESTTSSEVDEPMLGAGGQAGARADYRRDVIHSWWSPRSG